MDRARKAVGHQVSREMMERVEGVERVGQVVKTERHLNAVGRGGGNSTISFIHKKTARKSFLPFSKIYLNHY
ncbi:MAG: hypothetical protein A2Y12_17855 [Planctomycetes bacterium GWF2_42_9]|nr:MAG: hypothetical protein A2Y12_17855 [Planctomycetes bacterium GWF2_42_9]